MTYRVTYRMTIAPAGKGRFNYEVAGGLVEGCSSQPLLDACRQLKRMGADPLARIALFYGERIPANA